VALIVVSGAIANKLHQGGSAWVRLSYLLGLRRLGHRVHFVEQIAPQACVAHAFQFAGDSGCVGSSLEESRQAARSAQKTPRHTISVEDSANRAYFDHVMRGFDLSEESTLIPTDASGQAEIPGWLSDLADSATLLLNISGHLTLETLLRRFRRRVFIDLDPGFTQIWHASGNAAARLVGHNDYYTIAENIGRTGCGVPLAGIQWQTTRPPVVLDEWPVLPRPKLIRFTTVAHWRGPYGPLEFNGHTFGLKVHEFRRMLPLPQHVPAEFEMALDIDEADGKDLAALHANGWRIADPHESAGTPERFRQYVQRSGAEFSVAQGMYVQSRGGWFSDRTTRYLASGRPALVQDTGFSEHLPHQRGLVAFQTLEDAVEKAEGIVDNYNAHAKAARAVAEEFFDSDVVLGRLLKELRVEA
jgi:hypothetical protein